MAVDSDSEAARSVGGNEGVFDTESESAEMYFPDDDDDEPSRPSMISRGHPQAPGQQRHPSGPVAVVIIADDDDEQGGVGSITHDASEEPPLPPAAGPPNHPVPTPAVRTVRSRPGRSGDLQGRARPRVWRGGASSSIWNLSTVWVGDVSFVERSDQSVTWIVAIADWIG